MKRFCLVRHGQTDWNLAGRYQGQSDVPLNANGRAQARSLAELLRNQSFFAVYASHLQRAKETAEIIAADVNLTVLLDSRLAEVNQGEWEGQQIDTIKARYTGLWQQRSLDPVSVRPPGGETVAEVARRVHAALDDIADHHLAGPVLIVSHGLALATVICTVRSLPMGQAYLQVPDNATPIWVDWRE